MNKIINIILGIMVSLCGYTSHHLSEAYMVCADAVDYLDDFYAQQTRAYETDRHEGFISEENLLEIKENIGHHKTAQENLFNNAVDRLGAVQEGRTSMEDVFSFLINTRHDSLIEEYGRFLINASQSGEDVLFMRSVFTTNEDFLKAFGSEDLMRIVATHTRHCRQIYDHIIFLVWQGCDQTLIPQQARDVLDVCPQLWPILEGRISPYNVDNNGFWTGTEVLCGQIMKYVSENDTLSLDGQKQSSARRAAFIMASKKMDDQALLDILHTKLFQKKFWNALKAVDGLALTQLSCSGSVSLPEILAFKALDESEKKLSPAPFWKPSLKDDFLPDHLKASSSGPKRKQKKKGRKPTSKSGGLPDHGSQDETFTEAMAACAQPTCVPSIGTESKPPKETASLKDTISPASGTDPLAEAVLDLTLAPVNEPSSKPQAEGADASFIFPRFMRGRRANIPQEAEAAPYMKLSPHTQNFVDGLFGKEKPHNINFEDFQKFWIKIGGRIEGDGTSHRHLLKPGGSSTGLGTFVPHGRQKYSPKTIKNLRAAAYLVGCRPSA